MISIEQSLFELFLKMERREKKKKNLMVKHFKNEVLKNAFIFNNFLLCAGNSLYKRKPFSAVGQPVLCTVLGSGVQEKYYGIRETTWKGS